MRTGVCSVDPEEGAAESQRDGDPLLLSCTRPQDSTHSHSTRNRLPPPRCARLLPCTSQHTRSRSPAPGWCCARQSGAAPPASAHTWCLGTAARWAGWHPGSLGCTLRQRRRSPAKRSSWRGRQWLDAGQRHSGKGGALAASKPWDALCGSGCGKNGGVQCCGLPAQARSGAGVADLAAAQPVVACCAPLAVTCPAEPCGAPVLTILTNLVAGYCRATSSRHWFRIAQSCTLQQVHAGSRIACRAVERMACRGRWGSRRQGRGCALTLHQRCRLETQPETVFFK